MTNFTQAATNYATTEMKNANSEAKRARLFARWNAAAAGFCVRSDIRAIALAGLAKFEE